MNRSTSLTLFALVMGSTAGYGMAFICEGQLLANLETLTLVELEQYYDVIIFASLIGAGCQYAIAIYLLLMWIELFATFSSPNMAKQTENIKRFTIFRISASLFVILFETLSVGLLTKYASSDSYGKVWVQIIGTLIDLLVFFPVIVFGIIRWRELYVVLKDILRTSSRIGPRFRDLTKVTAIAIAGYVIVIIEQLLNFQYFNNQANDLFWFFLSMLPHLTVMLSVMYYFSPIRQLRREALGTPPSTNTTDLSGSPINSTDAIKMNSTGSYVVTPGISEKLPSTHELDSRSITGSSEFDIA